MDTLCTSYSNIGNFDRESPNVEVFLPCDGDINGANFLKPCVLPSRDGNELFGSSRARRRWKLLKNVITAVRALISLSHNKQKSKLIAIPEAMTDIEEKEEPNNETPKKGVSSDDSTSNTAELKSIDSLFESKSFSDDQVEKNCDEMENDHSIHLNKEVTVEHCESCEQKGKLGKEAREELLKRWRHRELCMSDSYVKKVSSQSSSRSLVDTPHKPVIVENFNISLRSIFSACVHPEGMGFGEDEDSLMLKDSFTFEEGYTDYSIIGTSVDDYDCSPHVLSPPIMHALRPHLPFAMSEQNFWLKYSMKRDGASIRCLLRQVRNSPRIILAIETMDGDVFGCFTSSLWKPRGRTFYGSGEAFVWRLKRSRNTPCNTLQDQLDLESDVEVFNWSGENHNVQSMANMESQLIVGGGGPDEDPFSFSEREDYGSALIISANMEHGTSDACLTFRSPSLPSIKSNDYRDGNIFQIANVEAWTMTPVDNLKQAEQLEIGRQFIYDHMVAQ